jgi:hypothetical protein
MINSLGKLGLSGSFMGAVYQERMLHAVLTGEPIFSWRMSLPKESKKKQGKMSETSSDWLQDSFLSNIFNTQPAAFIKYNKAHSFGNELYSASLPPQKFVQQPILAVFVPESQTFPSIDMTIAQFDHKTQHAILYHCSVSVDLKHFATGLASSGHLPLNIVNDPPTLFRSKLATQQVISYRDTLLGHELVRNKVVTHRYAVFDDNATDLHHPTLPFDQLYWVLSAIDPKITSTKRQGAASSSGANSTSKKYKH